ncbi:MAG TPA: three-Cys-motif partner protein TcmP [Solirubrobacterales bacterium]
MLFFALEIGWSSRIRRRCLHTVYSVAALSLQDLLDNAGPNYSPQSWKGREGLVVAPDGLPAREVKAHNIHKAHYIQGYAEIFARAMKNKWDYRCYLDLYCGPGVCWVKDTGRFVLGSPLIALSVDSPYTHFAFVDLDTECTAALEERMVGASAEVTVLSKDSNDRATINEVRGAIPDRNALSLALLDPQGCNLDFETIRYLTMDKPMDLLINLPVHNLWRCLCKGDTAVLDKVLSRGWPRQTAHNWRASVREHFHGKLNGIGYKHNEAKQVWSESKKSPLYDFILYSRVELAKKFFKEVTRTTAHQQTTLAV